jgi:hypothetical protein
MAVSVCDYIFGRSGQKQATKNFPLRKFKMSGVLPFQSDDVISAVFTY